MKIETGLFDHMVLQRSVRGVSDARITGRCPERGAVAATVTAGGKPVRGVRLTGRVGRDRFELRLRGVPTGGPYDVTLRIGAQTATVRDVLVGDVWVLAGQSNMQGCGRWVERAKPHPMTRACYMDDRWAVAEDPIHDLWNAVDEVHPKLSGGRAGPPPRLVARRQDVGPGVAFGQAMHKARSVPQGLIACAHGGTSMSQWDPALKKLGGDGLYGATVRRIVKNGGRIAGVCWYQGESDCNAEAAPLYTQRMKKLIAAFRRDSSDARLPFVLVQLGRFTGADCDEASWESVRDQQWKLPKLIRRTAFVPAIDLSLCDMIHVSGAAQQVLGRRLAAAMLFLLGDRKNGRAAIIPVAAKLERSANQLGYDLVFSFAHVRGSLQSSQPAVGFWAAQSPKKFQPHDVTIRGHRVRLHMTMMPHVLSSVRFGYAAGGFALGSISDEEGWPLCAFGPWTLAHPRETSPFFDTAFVSDLLPGVPRLIGLKLPRNVAKLTSRPITAQADGFINQHNDIAATAGQERVIYHRFPLVVPRSQKLLVALGYDGAVKLWIDGREVFHDPNGTNPAVPDTKEIKWHAKRGRHEIVLALSTNRGMAWGVFVRFAKPAVKTNSPSPDDFPKLVR